MSLIAGPRAAIPVIPVLSQGILGDMGNSIALLSLQDPTFYKRFLEKSAMGMRPHAELSFIQEICWRDWLELMWEAFHSGIPALGCDLIEVLEGFLDIERRSAANGGPEEDWYSYVVSEWNEYTSDLQKWRHEVHGETIEASQLPPYPWSRPSPLPIPAFGVQFYKGVYRALSVVGVERATKMLVAMPFLQDWLRLVL